jgi:glycosyltransferase involved in cell wall biosynthesis
VVPDPLRVAYTLEQCWHPVPGGTAVAALRVADRLAADPGIDLRLVAGRHRHEPVAEYRAATTVRRLPVGRPLLYETWLRARWPMVESVVGPVDVTHATAIIPAATRAPLVVTVHDLAFRRFPERFSRQGRRVMELSLDRIRERADRVIGSSRATLDDLARAGIPADRLRLVTLGVDPPPSHLDPAGVRARYELPDGFVLFVGTLEPRKNLGRLVEAVSRSGTGLPLVVAGADGWGDVATDVSRAGVQFLGFVPGADLPHLYAAASVFAYPSEWEGFGLPVAEAMAVGTPVVTSRGTSTEEVAGGAAVLVDATEIDDIARGLVEALERSGELAELGRRRAADLSWDATAAATVAIYREVAG